MVELQHWVGWLRSLDALAGLPMILVGLALMLGGWRMGRICVVLTLAAVGVGGGLYCAAGSANGFLFAASGAVLLGALGVALKQNSTAGLGGLLGTGIVMQLLTPLGLPAWALAVALVLTFLSLAAVCLCSSRTVIMVITSFEGAALLVSGLVPVLTLSPGLLRFFESTNRASWIFFPFLVLMPAAVGYFLQVADAKKHPAGAARV